MITDYELFKRENVVCQEGFAPHSTQWIGCIPKLIEAIATVGWGPFRAFPEQPIIVLAVDGLAYSIARDCWTPTFLAPLTSVFPTTSTTAWLSVQTGASVDEHRLAGVVYQTSPDTIYNAILDRYTGAQPSGVPFNRYRTLFHRLARHRRCVSLPGDLRLYPGRWRDALLAGSAVTWPEPDEQVGNSNGRDIARACRRQVARQIVNAARDGLVVWAFLNLDDYTHRNGYDASLRLALKEMEESICEWVSQGAVVVAVSDHGMTEVVQSPEKQTEWQKIEQEFSRLPSGGAGRTRWLYAKAGRNHQLLRSLKESFEDVALVCQPHDLVRLRLIGVQDSRVLARLGDAVVIGTQPNFPGAPNSNSYEHGAITELEMFVPLAIWGYDLGRSAWPLLPGSWAGP